MYWVTMTDKFMSGWGRAEGKTNKFVIACETYDDAYAIKQAAKARSEMKYVNICWQKPYYNKKNYLTSNKTFKDLNGPWKQYVNGENL